MPGHHPLSFTLLILATLLFCRPLLVLAAAGNWDTFMDGGTQNAIAAEPGGRVWVASAGGATAFDPGDSTYVRVFRNDRLPDQNLTAVAIDLTGNRWFGSKARGLQVQTPNGAFLPRPLDQFDLGSDSVRVLESVGDSVWAGTATGAALVTYPPDPDEPSGAVLLTFNIEAFLGQSPLVNAIAARADTTWFGTQRGVVRREPDGSRSLVNVGLSNLDVRDLTFFEGFLWAATATTVFRLEDGVWLERAAGLTTGQAFLSFAIFEQKLHVGKVASAVSVYRLTGLTWSARSSGVVNRHVTALAPAGAALWAATNRGIYVLGANDTWRRIPSVDPPDPDAFSLDTDYKDVSVIGSTTRACAVTRTFWTELGDTGWCGVARGQQGLENRDMFRVLVDREGRSWIGHCCCSMESECRVDRLDSCTGTAVAYPAFNILALAEAPDGRIWCGSVPGSGVQPKGLYRIDPESGQVENFTTASTPLASNSIQALVFDGDGGLWIGHTGQGVDIWSNPGSLPATITHLADGLPSVGVNAIAFREEEAWVGTASGIGVFAGTVHVRTIPGNTLPNPQVLDLAVDGCGRVWAATIAGVVVLDGEGVVLEVFDQNAAPGVVDERANRLDIDFATGTIWHATQNGLSRFIYDRSCAGTGGPSARICTRFCPYPNPFDPGKGEVLGLTDVGQTGPVRMAVLDAAGRELWSGEFVTGDQVWNGRDRDGDPVPTGLYLLRIESEGGRGGEGTVFRVLAVRR